MTTTEQPGRQIVERSPGIMVDGTRADFVVDGRPVRTRLLATGRARPAARR